jgi:hypothetical protein
MTVSRRNFTATVIDSLSANVMLTVATIKKVQQHQQKRRQPDFSGGSFVIKIVSNKKIANQSAYQLTRQLTS